MGDRQRFVLYVLICLEVGVFLLLVPWSVIWERNYFLQAYPMLGSVVLDPMFRGAVSGLGVANIYVGLNEVMARKAKGLASTELFPGGVPLRADKADGNRRTARSPERSDSEMTSAEPQAVTTHEKHS